MTLAQKVLKEATPNDDRVTHIVLHPTKRVLYHGSCQTKAFFAANEKIANIKVRR